MAQRYALVDGNNLVVNVVMWDGNTQAWNPPSGQTAVPTLTGNIGDTFTGPSTFTPNDPSAALLAALRASAVVNVDNSDAQYKLQRAVWLVVLDEINTLRTLGVLGLSARTPAQVRTAIINKINSGAAD